MQAREELFPPINALSSVRTSSSLMSLLIVAASSLHVVPQSSERMKCDDGGSREVWNIIDQYRKTWCLWRRIHKNMVSKPQNPV